MCRSSITAQLYAAAVLLHSKWLMSLACDASKSYPCDCRLSPVCLLVICLSVHWVMQQLCWAQPQLAGLVLLRPEILAQTPVIPST